MMNEDTLLKENSPVQKQQETLIVWSEGDNFDLALSFQEKVGNVYLKHINVPSSIFISVEYHHLVTKGGL